MPEQLISIGLIIIAIGFVLLLAGLLSQARSGKTRVEGGGIVFIGPIPIIGATNKQIFHILLLMSVIAIAVFLFLGRKI